MEKRSTRIGLWIWTALVIAFLWFPLVLIGVYAFNKSNVQSWPLPGLDVPLVPRRVAGPGRSRLAEALDRRWR